MDFNKTRKYYCLRLRLMVQNTSGLVKFQHLNNAVHKSKNVRQFIVYYGLYDLYFVKRFEPQKDRNNSINIKTWLSVITDNRYRYQPVI